ncbi:MAG TPA: DUF1622 domain-containing protein [Thermomicrobiales bacterium]|nr:DUF1622 domain-containing protein [Thermomicrobiales bacterium]
MSTTTWNPLLAETHEMPERLDWVLETIEYVGIAIDVLAVAVIVIAITFATVVFLQGRLHRADAAINYRTYRANLGAGLLLGLEILVAADVIRTVALEPTLESVAVLGVLVLIRIVLGWSIVVEIERRWPWQDPVSNEE